MLRVQTNIDFKLEFPTKSCLIWIDIDLKVDSDHQGKQEDCERMKRAHTSLFRLKIFSIFNHGRYCSDMLHFHKSKDRAIKIFLGRKVSLAGLPVRQIWRREREITDFRQQHSFPFFTQSLLLPADFITPTHLPALLTQQNETQLCNVVQSVSLCRRWHF